MDPWQARKIVRDAWRRNGYIKDREQRRFANQTLEARISVDSAAGVQRLRAALRVLDIDSGAPFTKARQLRVPIYGRDRVDLLMKLVGRRPRRWHAYSHPGRRRV